MGGHYYIDVNVATANGVSNHLLVEMRKADSPVPAAPIDQKSPSRGNNGANDHDDNPNSSDEPQASGKKKSGDKNGPTASPTDDHAGSAASNDGTSTLKPEKQDRHATGVQ